MHSLRNVVFAGRSLRANVTESAYIRTWGAHGRFMATTSTIPALRAAKEEGTIASVFSSLSGDGVIADAHLPQRFSDLKKEMWREGLVESWREVVQKLEEVTEMVEARGSGIIPCIPYDDITKGLTPEQVDLLKKVGSVVVTGGVPEEEALSWKQSIRDYVSANPNHVKGFPSENIQVFEIYNSIAQTLARTHPALLKTQKLLLSLWHTSDPATPISLSTPISYYDRLRMRLPGDAKFSLGPHIDGGSIERWEDPHYRQCFSKILEGGSAWKAHDPFDASPRLEANQDMYHAPNQCSVFRCWQGWTALSSTGPNEGTLRVLPFLSLSTAYLILRPFFRQRVPSSLALGDWELDLESSAFPGSFMARAQELNEVTHPHLKLGKTMVSVPKVQPGDQVYWHCDVVHAVEAQHRGVGDSSVLYIPAVPLTLHNAAYLRDQRSNFLAGLPAPDFPGGEGESRFTGRGTAADVRTPEGRRALGLQPFEVPLGSGAVYQQAQANLVHAANKILF